MTLGGDFYTLTIAENAAKMADKLGQLAGGIHDLVDDSYANELF
ncbi:hypothetical protein ACWWSA_12175 [Mycobacteroides abscessus subsp. abscessus]